MTKIAIKFISDTLPVALICILDLNKHSWYPSVYRWEPGPGASIQPAAQYYNFLLEATGYQIDRISGRTCDLAEYTDGRLIWPDIRTDIWLGRISERTSDLAGYPDELSFGRISGLASDLAGYPNCRYQIVSYQIVTFMRLPNCRLPNCRVPNCQLPNWSYQKSARHLTWPDIRTASDLAGYPDGHLIWLDIRTDIRPGRISGRTSDLAGYQDHPYFTH